MRGKRKDLDCDSAVRWLLRFVDGDISTLSSEERAEWLRWSSEPGNLGVLHDRTMLISKLTNAIDRS